MEQQPTNENVCRARIDLLLLQAGARMRERFARACDWLAGLRRRDRRKLLRRLRTSLALLALLLATSGMPIPAHAASMTVAAGAAGLVTDGKCSLAEAIVNANDDMAMWSDCPAGSGADTITLPANATLSYTTPYDISNALPPINSDITIEGFGSTIQRTGGPAFRIFSIRFGSLTLNRVTVKGGLINADRGAGIDAQGGSLTLKNSTVSGNNITGTNSQGGEGAGIAVMGSALIQNSTISGNVVATNMLSSYGGGITSNGDLTIVNSTISGNTSRAGGGIAIRFGSTTIINSTVTGNTASATLLANGRGGGIYGKPVLIAHTIVAGNTTTGSGNETFSVSLQTSNNTNLFGHSGESTGEACFNWTSFGTDITATSDGTQPTALASILNPTLANNGGPTQTHNLVAGSPALDKATGNSCQAAPVNGLDQRYKVRAAGASATCDIGAVEFNAPTAVTLSSFNAKPGFDLVAWFKQMLGLAR